MLQLQRGDRQHGHSRIIDKERVFIGAVCGTAVFNDTQPAGSNLVYNTKIKQDHTVGNVFFQALACECIAASFTRNKRSNSFILQPVKKPPDLSAKYCSVLNAAE